MIKHKFALFVRQTSVCRAAALSKATDGKLMFFEK